jgi:transposase
MSSRFSSRDCERIVVVRQVVEGNLRLKEGCERLGICERQLKRLVKNWRLAGDEGLASRRHGRVAANALSPEMRQKVEELLRNKYSDFGATFAAEKLSSAEGLAVSRETVRQIQIHLGLHHPKRRRGGRVFQSRERRPRFGELVQIDGSPHDWFEGRGPKCTLIVFIDDATSRLTSLLFAPAETTKAYLLSLRRHILTYGLPLAFYSDRHGIFRVNAKDAKTGDGYTEFGRVLKRLKIESICAHTPQAKGRVERANRTLQDRLIKEMRLQGIWSIEDGNVFLQHFMQVWNKSEFTKPAREQADAHRPWNGSRTELEDALGRHETRILSNSLTFQYHGVSYAVKVKGPGTALRNAKVTLIHDLEEKMQVRYKDRILDVTAYKTRPMPSPTEDEKTIDARMAKVIAQAQEQTPQSLRI